VPKMKFLWWSFCFFEWCQL